MKLIIQLLAIALVIFAFGYYIYRNDKRAAFEWLLEFKNRRAVKEYFAKQGIQLVYVMKGRRVVTTFSRKGVKHTRNISFAKAYSLYTSHDLKNKLIRLRKSSNSSCIIN